MRWARIVESVENLPDVWNNATSDDLVYALMTVCSVFCLAALLVGTARGDVIVIFWRK